MTYEVYRYIFIGAAVLCGIMIVLAILLFVLLKIPKVIGDLSGSTAKKAIKNIREQNEKSGDKAYKVSAYNRDRGKLTDKISTSGTLQQRTQTQLGGLETVKIDSGYQPNASNETTVLGAETSVLGAETSVLTQETSTLFSRTADLNGQNETTVLSEQNGTTVLSGSSGETTVLSDANETTVLSQNGQSAFDPAFEIEYDITFIHTDEIIA